MRSFFSLVYLLCIACFTHAEQNIISLGVSRFIAQDIDTVLARKVTDRMREEFVNNNDFNCVERDKMDAILAERSLQEKYCSSKECVINLGRALNVSFMISGTIGMVGELYTMTLRVVDIASGDVIYTVNTDCKCPVETFYTVKTKEAVDGIASKLTEKMYSKLSITSIPEGASVRINSSLCGNTPYVSEKISADIYQLEVIMESYDTVKQSVEIVSGIPRDIAVTLNHTKRFQDSCSTIAIEQAKKAALEMAASKKKERIKRIKIIGRIGSGVLTAGLVAAGYYMDMQVQQTMEEKQALYNSYLSANNYQQIQSYKQQYDEAHDQGNSQALLRNTCYAGASITAACFTITFFF